MDEAKLHQFVGQMLNDLGGAVSIALVQMGDALGLYKTLHQKGPMTTQELAAEAGVNERYLREWASHHAASNYLSYDPATKKFALPPEQAMVFAIDESPVNLVGAFGCMAAIHANLEKVTPAFKNGGGVAWGDQSTCMFCAVARFFRPGYQNHLVSEWLPALDGVVAKLERGARVADVGCGHGVSTMLMAKAFPKSEFIGYDFHPSSIEAAQAHAAENGVSANTRFEVAAAKGLPRWRVVWVAGRNAILPSISSLALSVSLIVTGSIVTEIAPASTFWRAEDYHQQYLAKRGMGACHV